MVCSSGIACKVYENGVESNVYSYYGLGAADMPSSSSLARNQEVMPTASKTNNFSLFFSEGFAHDFKAR